MLTSVSVKMLLDFGTNPNQKDSIGNTPLHLGLLGNVYFSRKRDWSFAGDFFFVRKEATPVFELCCLLKRLFFFYKFLLSFAAACTSQISVITQLLRAGKFSRATCPKQTS